MQIITLMYSSDNRSTVDVLKFLKFEFCVIPPKNTNGTNILHTEYILNIIQPQ